MLAPGRRSPSGPRAPARPCPGWTACGTASSGWSAVSARRARPQRSRSSRLDAPSAWTRPSRASGEAHDFRDEGQPPAHDFRRLGIEQCVHELAGGAGPVGDVSAATTGRRTLRSASRGMSAPMSSRSRGGLSQGERMRAKSPDRRSAMAAITGSWSAVRHRPLRLTRLGQGAEHRRPVEPAEALHGREVGERVLGVTVLEVFALASEPSLRAPHVSGPQAARDEQLRSRGHHAGHVHRRGRAAAP